MAIAGGAERDRTAGQHCSGPTAPPASAAAPAPRPRSASYDARLVAAEVELALSAVLSARPRPESPLRVIAEHLRRAASDSSPQRLLALRAKAALIEDAVQYFASHGVPQVLAAALTRVSPGERRAVLRELAERVRPAPRGAALSSHEESLSSHYGSGLERAPSGTRSKHAFYGKGSAPAADLPQPPLVGVAPEWPDGGRPPQQWGPGQKWAEGGIGALHQARRVFESLAACKKVPVTAEAAQAQQQQRAGQPAAEPTMLPWLFSLPAVWDAAGFPTNFANFQTWRYSDERYAELGGCRYHASDIVCEDPRHLPRTGGARTCCVARNAAEVLHRILARLDQHFRPVLWQAHADWEAQQKLPAAAGGASRPEPPEVPVSHLDDIAVHDVIEGILACFIYSYNLQLPNDMSQAKTVQFPGRDALRLSGAQIRSLEQGADCKLVAKQVIVAVNGKQVSPEDDLGALLAAARHIDVVPARCEQRPLQLFGGMNWAMRERPEAEGEQAKRLDTALAIFRPLIWRLDKFILRMGRSPELLFRGMARVRTGRHYKLGENVIYHSFTSLSTDRGTAWDFAGDDGGTWAIILPHSAMPIHWISQFPGERELLLPSNTEFTVMDKPADSTLALCCTTHDTFALAQTRRGWFGERVKMKPAEVFRQRVKAMRSQDIIFRDLAERYVEPRVLWQTEPADKPAPPRAEGHPLRLFEAFDHWLMSPTQWLLIIAPVGEGKSSALLSIHAKERRDIAPEEGGEGEEHSAISVFMSFSLMADPTDGADWLRRQLLLQLNLQEPELEVLERCRMVYLCDSADESSARPERLRERSLADRCTIPAHHKGVITVRRGDMERRSLTPSDYVGAGGAVLDLQSFGHSARTLFCEKQGVISARKAVRALEKVPQGDASKRAAALEDLPGRLPSSALQARLHRAVLCKDPAVSELEKEWKEQAVQDTQQWVLGMDSKAIQNALLFTMAAEAAQDLSQGADSSAVIDAWLRRRMRRQAARVDHKVWEAHKLWVSQGRVDLLMRAAEILSAELTWHRKRSMRIDIAVKGAAELCANRIPAELFRRLLPGIPLRVADAENPACKFALPHGKVQDCLAMRWACRAAERGELEKAVLVMESIHDWAASYEFCAIGFPRVAELAEQKLPHEEAMPIRITAARRQAISTDTAEKLVKLRAECEERYGPEHDLTLTAMRWEGVCLINEGRAKEAIPRLRKALELREMREKQADVDQQDQKQPDADLQKIFDLSKSLGVALCRTAPPGESAQRAEGERLLRRAMEGRRDKQPEGAAMRCQAELARSMEERGAFAEAEEMLCTVVAWSEKTRGHHHPKTLAAVCLLANCMEHQGHWEEARPLRRRSTSIISRVPQGHRHVHSEANQLAAELYREGKAHEAEQLLKDECLWDERQRLLESERAHLRDEFFVLGAECYADWLRDQRAGIEGRYPELLDVVDQQLALLGKGQEPWQGAEAEREEWRETVQEEAAEALVVTTRLGGQSLASDSPATPYPSLPKGSPRPGTGSPSECALLSPPQESPQLPERVRWEQQSA